MYSSIRKVVKYIECTEMALPEFLLFVLTATLGGMFLCGANDLITIFVAPECLNLCSYLLSGYTKKDVRSNESTTKYLLPAFGPEPFFSSLAINITMVNNNMQIPGELCTVEK